MLPNLIIPGYTRTGTTWLYTVLKKHPEIYLPKRKEIHYFDKNFNKGLEFYERFYSGYNNEKYCGDFSPTYILDIENAKKIKDTLKDLRIIIVLRNPIDRLFSNYLKIKREKFANYSFSDVINKNYLSKKLHYNQVHVYCNQFPRKDILFLIYEDLKINPVVYIKKILDFLNIESEKFLRSINILSKKRENPTIIPKSLFIHRIFHYTDRVLRKSNNNYIDTGLDQLLDLYKKLFVRNINFEKRETVNIVDRIMISNYFFSDILALSDLIGRDLIKFWQFDKISKK